MVKAASNTLPCQRVCSYFPKFLCYFSTVMSPLYPPSSLSLTFQQQSQIPISVLSIPLSFEMSVSHTSKHVTQTCVTRGVYFANYSNSIIPITTQANNCLNDTSEFNVYVLAKQDFIFIVLCRVEQLLYLPCLLQCRQHSYNSPAF